MTYKAIGFDWGGVLNGKPGKVFGETLASMLDITFDEYRIAYFHHNTAFNSGKINGKELWRRVLEELSKLDQLDEVLAYVDDSLKDDPNTDVIRLVDRLHSSGYKVGLLSNNTDEMGLKIRASGLDRHFDVFHISAETGYAKPTPQAFTFFAEALGVTLGELIFVDDTAKSLSTAEDIGFTPILFTDYDQLVAELNQLGIRT